MLKDPSGKYRPYGIAPLADRRWPDAKLTRAPLWCSVDLRDGNQALIEPMDRLRKRRMFDLLVATGFKQIEIGFPSASQTEFDFCRELIDQKVIPDDVTIQVLTPARPELIRRTFEALRGVPRAVLHYYNATAPVFRRVVFRQDKAATIKLAVDAAKVIRELAAAQPETQWTFEYSPEAFTATEQEFALEICEAVLDAFGATAASPVILNLPATVEVATPNIYADQIEWFCRHLKDRRRAIVSLHPHNDRGTGIAAAELGMMAGADRVEGTLFGNGERTGNVDIVTLALNLYTQGVDPQLDFSNINEAARCVEYCNQLFVTDRLPPDAKIEFREHGGSPAVHLSIDGKEMGKARAALGAEWGVAPALVGSGGSIPVVGHFKSILGMDSLMIGFGLDDDRIHSPNEKYEVSRQAVSDSSGKEVTAAAIWQLFENEYLVQDGREYQYRGHHLVTATDGTDGELLTLNIVRHGQPMQLTGRGNGPIDALVHALALPFDVLSYEEKSIGKGSEAKAAAFVEITTPSRVTLFGVGVHANIITASILAVLSAVRRADARDLLPSADKAVGA